MSGKAAVTREEFEDLTESVTILAETLEVVVRIAERQNERISELETRLKGALEVNNLWDGS